MLLPLRVEIEQYLKDHPHLHTQIKEAPKHSYESIIQQIELRFVDKSKNRKAGIHWANMGMYRKDIPFIFKAQDKIDFLTLLPKIIPKSESTFWLLIETQGDKYWLYEGTLPAITEIINHIVTSDFYIVSKKMEWLISENHHDVWSFVGEKLKLSCLEEST